MKNPFPGMNPYLENRWRDVHARLVVYIGDAVQQQLPPGLQARVEEDVLIDGLAPDTLLARPDVYVAEQAGRTPAKSSGSGSPETSVPTIILLDDPPQPRHVEIVDVEAGDRVVTAIELLSITNKDTTDGRFRYQTKQRAYRAAGVNLVEIDLLRQGEYVLSPDWSRIPPSKRRLYNISVHRAIRPRQYAIYGAMLRDRLPVIAIPLRSTDADVALDIQKLIDDYHDRSGFGSGGLEYSRPLDPPLTHADEEWVSSVLNILPE